MSKTIALVFFVSLLFGSSLGDCIPMCWREIVEISEVQQFWTDFQQRSCSSYNSTWYNVINGKVAQSAWGLLDMNTAASYSTWRENTHSDDIRELWNSKARYLWSRSGTVLYYESFTSIANRPDLDIPEANEFSSSVTTYSMKQGDTFVLKSEYEQRRTEYFNGTISVTQNQTQEKCPVISCSWFGIILHKLLTVHLISTQNVTLIWFDSVWVLSCIPSFPVSAKWFLLCPQISLSAYIFASEHCSKICSKQANIIWDLECSHTKKNKTRRWNGTECMLWVDYCWLPWSYGRLILFQVAVELKPLFSRSLFIRSSSTPLSEECQVQSPNCSPFVSFLCLFTTGDKSFFLILLSTESTDAGPKRHWLFGTLGEITSIPEDERLYVSSFRPFTSLGWLQQFAEREFWNGRRNMEECFSFGVDRLLVQLVWLNRLQFELFFVLQWTFQRVRNSFLHLSSSRCLLEPFCIFSFSSLKSPTCKFETKSLQFVNRLGLQVSSSVAWIRSSHKVKDTFHLHEKEHTHW